MVQRRRFSWISFRADWNLGNAFEMLSEIGNIYVFSDAGFEICFDFANACGLKLLHLAITYVVKRVKQGQYT